MAQSAVVFLSSSDKISPMFFSEVEKLGRALARKNIRVICGGGRVGLMGCIADAILSEGGQVVGVIPEYWAVPGIMHPDLSETIVVPDLLDRKRKMLSLADVAVASPGGIGTIDEITEVITLKQANEHQKPIVFHNFLEFWNPMLEYFEELHRRHMIQQNLEDLWTTLATAEEVADFIEKA